MGRFMWLRIVEVQIKKNCIDIYVATHEEGEEKGVYYTRCLSVAVNVFFIII